MKYIFSLLFVIAGLFSHNAFALEFPMPAPGDDIVGQTQTMFSKKGDTLVSIGHQYNIGAYEMWQANPDLGRSLLKPDTEVLIPSQFILPTTRKGLVANLAEMRVYYFPENENVVFTFPIGVGQQGWNTPRTSGTVIKKKLHPTWYVPASIQAKAARAGRPLPKSVPPGPKNPLGKYALYLSIPSILLHGTN